MLMAVVPPTHRDEDRISRRLVRRWVALTALGCCLSAPAAAGAQANEEEIESEEDDDAGSDSHLALVLTGRVYTAQLAEDYYPGVLMGVEAAYQPGPLGVGLRIAWTMPSGLAEYGLFGAKDETSALDHLQLTEMAFWLRIRFQVSEVFPHSVVGGIGAELLRSSIAIPPDGDRRYFGPFVGLGIKQRITRTMGALLDLRYGMIWGGPTGYSVTIGWAFGS